MYVVQGVFCEYVCVCMCDRLVSVVPHSDQKMSNSSSILVGYSDVVGGVGGGLAGGTDRADGQQM